MELLKLGQSVSPSVCMSVSLSDFCQSVDERTERNNHFPFHCVDFKNGNLDVSNRRFINIKIKINLFMFLKLKLKLFCSCFPIFII